MYESQLDKEKSLSEKLDDISEKLEKGKEKRKFRLPARAKVNKLRSKQGYVTLQIIHENGAVEFRREPIIDSVIKLSDGNNITFHAIDSTDVLHYKGKPFLLIPKSKKNPYNPAKGENETYGDKYILARMLSDTVKLKKGMGWGISIGIIVIVGIVAYSIITGA